MFENLLRPTHLLLILLIVLLIFGPGKLPDIGKSLGDAIKGFKSSMKEEKEPTEPKPPTETTIIK